MFLAKVCFPLQPIFHRGCLFSSPHGHTATATATATSTATAFASASAASRLPPSLHLADPQLTCPRQVIHETYGIKQGLMSTVHAVTATQQVSHAPPP